MISKEQNLEIEQYLISKKLPFDILIEVKDHFISQIGEMIKKENLDFHIAFESVKNDWQDELRMKRNWFLNINAPNFVYKIMVESDKKILQKSFVIVLVIQLFTFLFATNQVSNGHFNWFYLILTLSFFISPILILAYNFRHLNFFKIKKGTFQYSYYQRHIIGYFGFFAFLNSTIFDSSNSSDKLLNLFRGQDMSNKNSWILLVVTFMMQICIVFTNINLFQHSKTVNRIKKYISNCN